MHNSDLLVWMILRHHKSMRWLSGSPGRASIAAQTLDRIAPIDCSLDGVLAREITARIWAETSYENSGQILMHPITRLRVNRFLPRHRPDLSGA